MKPERGLPRTALTRARGARVTMRVARAAAWAAVLLLGPLAAADVAVTLYNTGDLHEHAADLPRIAAFVAARRREDPRVLFVDCGDVLNRGDPEYVVTRGEAMFETLSACGLDAAILGNHDLSFGAARTVELLNRFRYPLLDANTVWPEGLRPRDAPPYRVFRLPGVTVAVVGTASEHINHRNEPPLARRTVPDALRGVLERADAESDIVVLLTHVGTERDLALAEELCREYAGRARVDLILGAHDHQAYPRILVHPPGGIAIQHSGDNGRWLGETILIWDGTRVTGRRSRLIPITADMPEDPAVAAVRDRYRAALPPDRALITLDQAAEPAAVLPWLGALAAAQAGADVALLPPRAVRTGWPAVVVLPAALVQAVARLEPLCFTLPDAADLAARLEAIPDPAARPLPCPARPGLPARGPLRVAWFCVAADEPTPADPGPLLAGLPPPERRIGLDLWEVVLRAAADARAQGRPCLSLLPFPAGPSPAADVRGGVPTGGRP